VTLLPWIIQQEHNIYGFWYITTNDSSSIAICWLKINSPTNLGPPIWCLFFLPLFLVYLFCSLMVVLAYFRLRKGLSQSFLPRVKLLITSITNIVVLMLYWGLAMFMYGITFVLRGDVYDSNNTFKVLMLFIASKAFSSLVVWINQTDYLHPKKDEDNATNDSVDANEALREEVLSFATAGIRSTSRREIINPDIPFLKRKPFLADFKENTLITPGFFFRLLFDHDGDGLKAIQTMMEQNKRQMKTVGGDEEYQRLVGQSTVSVSVADGTRLSQRQTLPSNSLTHNPLTFSGVDITKESTIVRDSNLVEPKNSVIAEMYEVEDAGGLFRSTIGVRFISAVQKFTSAFDT
jgi:hypothetical protein